MEVKRLRAVDDQRRQFFVELLENRLGKAGADVADRLVGVATWIVGSKKESAIDGCPFPAAVVCAEDNQIE